MKQKQAEISDVLAPQRRVATLGAFFVVVAIATSLASCSRDTAEKTGTNEQALNISPRITDFVLYAERSINLGSHDQVSGGDIGVAALTTSSFGAQLVIGPNSQVDPAHTVLSPSTTLDLHASVGDVQTNLLTNNGGTFHAQAPYPFSLPLLPLARPSNAVGSDVTVASHQTVTLAPGTYGALTIADHGVVLLQAGSFFFSNVSVGEHSQMLGDPGGVTVQVAGTFTAAAWTMIAPQVGGTADKLTLEVAGNDGENPTVPAVSLAPHVQLTALLAAPHGTLSLADHVQLLGAFAAFDVASGDYLQATFQDGFSTATAYPHGQQPIDGEVPQDIALGKLPVVGTVPNTFRITLTIGLPFTNHAALRTLIEQLYDPGSPQYHKYLTPQQFADGFGATQADYDDLIVFAQSNGLEIENTYPSRYLLSVRGPASVVESAFFVSLNLYERADGTRFYGPANEPSANLSTSVLHITGFDNLAIPRRADGTGQYGCGINPSDRNYAGNDFRAAYLPCTSLKGDNQSIALVEFDSYLRDDITAYANAFHVTVPTLTNVPVKGTSFSPDWGGASAEVVADIDMVMDVAPNATVYVYEEDITQQGTIPRQAIPSADADEILGRIAGDDVAQVISSSYVWLGGEFDANIPNIFEEYAVQGQSFFQASGDSGSYASPTNQNPAGATCLFAQVVPEPIIDTPLMTVVGGTILTTAQGPTFPNPYPSPYYTSETAWKDPNVTGLCPAAGGGGFATAPSTFIPTLPMPTYQNNVNVLNTEIMGDLTATPPLQGNVSQARMVPDVSIVADEFTIFWSGETAQPDPIMQPCQWGTSYAAPLWAGIAALANESSTSGRVGFANPMLYRLAASQTSYEANFHDVTTGDNNLDNVAPYQYHAQAGYDLATGLGSPTCNILANLSCQTTDFSTDPNNCGACGQVCTGTCQFGHCTVVLATGQNLPEGIAVDSANVYWANYPPFGGPGQVMTSPIGGGIVTTLVSSPSFLPWDITVDPGSAGDVFWSDSASTYIFSTPKTGGNSVPLYAGSGVAAAGGQLYWFQGGPGDLSHPLVTAPEAGGGTPVTLATATFPIGAIAVDSQYVYWTDRGADVGQGSVNQTPIAGGATITLASWQGQPGGIAIDSTNVYWANDWPFPGTVLTVPKGGGNATRTLATQPDGFGIVYIAADGTNVYFGGPGSLLRVSKLGGNVTQIAAALQPAQLVVDSSSVYWVDHGISGPGTVNQTTK